MKKQFAAVLLAASSLGGAAHAHHAMDGKLVQSFGEGVLSGLAHPVIGLDHFAFILAIGMMSAFLARGWVLPVLFVAASTTGVAVHLLGFDLWRAESLVALSVAAAGVALLSAPKGGLLMWACLAGLAGMAHGYAFGESVVGAEATPIAGYLAGLGIVSMTIAFAAQACARAVLAPHRFGAARLRWAGATVFAVGGLALLASAT